MIREVDDQRLVLAPSGNSYEIALHPVGVVSMKSGQRINGRIEAEALKIHPADGGGIFIEPLVGEPRVVAGRVVSVDADAGRVVLESVLPITLAIPAESDLLHCGVGRFVNCYVRSGATFTPSA